MMSTFQAPPSLESQAVVAAGVQWDIAMKRIEGYLFARVRKRRRSFCATVVIH